MHVCRQLKMTRQKIPHHAQKMKSQLSPFSSSDSNFGRKHFSFFFFLFFFSFLPKSFYTFFLFFYSTARFHSISSSHNFVPIGFQSYLLHEFGKMYSEKKNERRRIFLKEINVKKRQADRKKERKKGKKRAIKKGRDKERKIERNKYERGKERKRKQSRIHGTRCA